MMRSARSASHRLSKVAIKKTRDSHKSNCEENINQPSLFVSQENMSSRVDASVCSRFLGAVIYSEQHIRSNPTEHLGISS
jgi:hypothetical protein